MISTTQSGMKCEYTRGQHVFSERKYASVFFSSNEGQHMKEKYTPEEVDYGFAGFNEVDEAFRIILAKAISKLPRKVVDWITKNLLFISSSNEYFAFYLPKHEWKHKKGFVFLSETLRNESEENQTFKIAHEIAHAKLNHKSPIFSDLTEIKMKRQERKQMNWLKNG